MEYVNSPNLLTSDGDLDGTVCSRQDIIAGDAFVSSGVTWFGADDAKCPRRIQIYASINDRNKLRVKAQQPKNMR